MSAIGSVEDHGESVLNVAQSSRDGEPYDCVWKICSRNSSEAPAIASDESACLGIINKVFVSLITPMSESFCFALVCDGQVRVPKNMLKMVHKKRKNAYKHRILLN